MKYSNRTAVLLRFFENKSLREVGDSLGTTDDTAQKRVNRAIERLREFFAKRGVAVGASGLVVVISANAVQAVPVGLVLTISTAAALGGTTIAATATATATKAIAMSVTQKAIITAAFAAAVGTGIYEARQVSQSRDQVRILQQQQAPLVEQLTQLKTANERLSNQLAQTRDSQGLANEQFRELMKLRGKVGVAQADSDELAKLKSTLAAQTGKTSDALTNALAVGMGAAGKVRMKNEQARLDLMKKTLHLSDDQARAITNIMRKHIQRQTEMVVEAMSGKKTPEQRQAMAVEGSNQEDEIKMLLTAEQLAAYPQYQQAEKAAAADKSANEEASEIAGDYRLSKEQHDQIRAAFYQMNLSEPPNGLNKEAIAAAGQSGNLAEALSMRIELSKSQLEEKLKILSSVLTPEQINGYRAEQMKQIEALAAAMKMLRPQKSVGTTN